MSYKIKIYEFGEGISSNGGSKVLIGMKEK